MFEDVEEELEKKAGPVSEVDKLIVDEQDREARWLAKRAGKITSSVLPKLMSKGRGKGIEWGETAKSVIREVINEIISGKPRKNLKLYQFEYGHEMESKAIGYYREKAGENILSGSEDFEDILFVEPYEGFGDSPDAVLEDYSKVYEIKCPESGDAHLRYCEMNAIHDKVDYYWQFCGHLLATGADELVFISYKDEYPDNHPLKMHVVIMKRSEHLMNIKRLEARIMDAIFVINEVIQKGNPTLIGNIEQILNERS